MIFKKLFGTPLKATLSIMSLAAIVALLGTGTVYATSAIAKNSSIGAENAKNFSFADAGIDPFNATAVKTEFDYEQGQFVYEVEFIADGKEYEYWIKASDGTVVKKEIEIVALEQTDTTSSSQITLEEAKRAALSDAGLTMDAVTFTTAELDKEDGISVYDIEFIAKNVEYEYEINANTGAIFSKSQEAVETKNAQQPEASTTKQATTSKQGSTDSRTGSDSEQKATKPAQGKQETAANQITLDAAKAKALANAGVDASSVTYTEAKLDYEDGMAVYEIEFYTSTHEYEYEINAVTGAVQDKSVEKLQSSKGKGQDKTGDDKATSSSGTYIGIDKAKSIAVNHAGLSGSDVAFSKAKLDKDDGNTVYEIEFYQDGIEYEYEIDASSGNILEYETEEAD